jgi:hypothetical protein
MIMNNYKKFRLWDGELIYDRTKRNKERATKPEAKGLRLDMLMKLKYDDD